MKKLQPFTHISICRAKCGLLSVFGFRIVLRFLGYAMLGAILLTSCFNRPRRMILDLPFEPEEIQAPRDYEILDYKNKTKGEIIPEWVNLWLESGISEIENLYVFSDCFVFIHRNEGNNFNALNLWNNNFSPVLDFPRLAASRIEARFSTSITYPDEVYGDFFEILVRAASDAPWTGATKEGDFWILKKYLPYEDEPETESWEFLILVIIEKSNFTSQLNTIFEKINPKSPPTKEQLAAIDQVKNNFYEGF